MTKAEEFIERYLREGIKVGDTVTVNDRHYEAKGSSGTVKDTEQLR